MSIAAGQAERAPMRSRALYALLLGLGALDAGGYSLIAPVLPGLAAQTGADGGTAGRHVPARDGRRVHRGRSHGPAR